MRILEKAKKYYEQYPEDTSVVVDASGICVYGIDERYILMGSIVIQMYIRI